MTMYICVVGRPAPNHGSPFFLMTRVIGQIESLRRVKSELHQSGITQVTSVGDINACKENYEAERQEIIDVIESELYSDIEVLKSEQVKLAEAASTLNATDVQDLNDQVSSLKESYEQEFLAKKFKEEYGKYKSNVKK